jgi:cell wall-associated NlpC family hydrolase
VTTPLSDYLDRNPLDSPALVGPAGSGLAGDRPAPAPDEGLSTFFGQSLLPDEFAASPDNMLAENAAQDQVIPQTPAVGTPAVHNEPNTVPAPPGAAAPTGDAAAMIDAAMSVIGRNYVWGGTFGGGGGGDCSGLLYYAFNQAGIHMPRYRARDYGQMGFQVSVEDARPGDIVYFDNPGETDHVGIYLGNGQFIEAARPGTQVMVSNLRRGAQLRRILPDDAMSSIPVDPASGKLTFHGDNKVFNSAGRAPATHPGAQRDPVEQLQQLDSAMSVAGIENQGRQVNDLLANMFYDTPDSLFGQASAAGRRSLTPAFGPGPLTSAAPSGGGGLTVGQATGLSPAEAWIITHESSGRTDADNPTSTAFGFGQLLADNRAAYGRRFGFNPDTTDAGEQLVMFRAYVRDRYGTAEAAQHFWQTHGWY